MLQPVIQLDAVFNAVMIPTITSEPEYHRRQQVGPLPAQLREDFGKGILRVQLRFHYLIGIRPQVGHELLGTARHAEVQTRVALSAQAAQRIQIALMGVGGHDNAALAGADQLGIHH